MPLLLFWLVAAPISKDKRAITNEMRWLIRVGKPLQGCQPVIRYDTSSIIVRTRRLCAKTSCVPQRSILSSRRFSNCPRHQNSNNSIDAPKSSPAEDFKPIDKSHKGFPQWVVFAVIFTASAGGAYLYRRVLCSSRSSGNDVINTSTFSAFTIVEREQVSPTAFIITLQPGAENAGSGFHSERIGNAWDHGLWSVEIKQPQLQIARNYTPLPPSLSEVQGDGIEGRQPSLRFLIRKMNGGEMSSYLSRQQVGDTIWLRGPHLGFDVERRLGISHDVRADAADGGAASPENVVGARNVVFIAGGTGIAPALQIAHKLLDDPMSNDNDNLIDNPRISILWANRQAADALGREQQPVKSNSWLRSWFSGYSRSVVQEAGRRVDSHSSLALQIQDLKRRHGPRFEISYFVDEEGSFIRERDIHAALISPDPSAAKSGIGLSPLVDDKCTWHSPIAVQTLPDDNDASRFSGGTTDSNPCTCDQGGKKPGANLLCVSGPDGFIQAYAGAKRWHEGHEMQGPVCGIIGRILETKSSEKGRWLVLKL
ncbi:hypothetical protein F5Y16DRAFT_38498 [Xylariaceae sp. FL0255]|nr:hypothetical protein F5Y16DRAFT_38498 [Xylariaceae sp. FL0255]